MTVETKLFSPEHQVALKSLLDDPSPKVRQHLLGFFNTTGREAREFLENVAHSHHRALAWHARWFLEELRFTDPVAEFTGFIRSLNYELETGALLLSRTVLPATDAGACCAELDRLAARCRELIAEPATARERCRVINRVLFHDEGFRGNREHYTDPFNSLLPQVLERRKGLPITLGIIYLLIAQRIGLELEPVGLPGHFVVGCFQEDEPFFIDPFEQGVFRTSGEIMAYVRQHKILPKASDLAPTPVREVLARCCRNLVEHYTIEGNEAHARMFAAFVEEFEAAYERHTTP